MSSNNPGKRQLNSGELSMEFAAGVFFFAALVILAFFTILMTHDDLFGPKVRWEVLFPEVAGLVEGDNVRVQGVDVGRVETIRLADEGGVLVRLRLKQTVKLYRDCTIEIGYSSVLGGRHVAISVGTPGAGLMPPDTRLAGVTPPDLIQSAGRLLASIEKEVVPKVSRFADDMSAISADLRAGKGTLGKLLNDQTLYDRGTEVMQSLKQAGDNVNGLIGDVRAGKGTLGKLATDDSLFTDIRAITSDVRAGKGTVGKLFTDDTLFNNFRDVGANLKKTTDQLATGESSLGRLLNDKGEVYTSLKNTLGNAEVITADIRAGKGTLGKLATDPALYDDTRKTILEVRGAVQDFREQTPVFTFGSLVIGGL